MVIRLAVELVTTFISAFSIIYSGIAMDTEFTLGEHYVHLFH